MKIIIEPNQNGEDEVIFRCHDMTPEMMRLVTALKAPRTIIGYDDNKIVKVKVKDIYYCEVVDAHTFLYTAEKIYESKQRLYELEGSLGLDFVRTSKSVIVNVEAIKSLRPALNGRYEMLLENDETIIISRAYVPLLKEYLGI